MPELDSSSVEDAANRLGSGVQASWHDAGFTNPVRLDRVDSTNRFVRDAALLGAPEGLVVVAEEQFAGRGRRGRTWSAPPGSSIICSILFRPSLGHAELHLLPSLVGLAALDALRATVAVEASLKWPNDILVADAKLAGILSEIVPAPELAVVVGIGMNVSWPEGWPPAGPLDELTRRATTVERAASGSVDREALCAAMLAAVESGYRGLATPAGRRELAVEYRAACATIGRDVRLELVDTTVEGRVVDVDDDGRLVLEIPGGERRRYDVGDIVHLR